LFILPANAFIVDAQGDVAAAGLPTQMDNLDLLSVSITESEPLLTWELEIQTFDNAAPTANGNYEINWEFEGAKYRIYSVWVRPIASTEDNFNNQFTRFEETSVEWKYPGKMEFEKIGNQLTFGINWDNITNAAGIPALTGSQLTNVYARAMYPYLSGNVGIDFIQDRAPDLENASYEIQRQFQVEGLHVSTPTPLRASNGEPATYVFPIRLANQGTEPQTVLLETLDVPKNWETWIISPKAELGGAELKETAIVVNVKGSPQHGGTETFALRATNPVNDFQQDLSIGIVCDASPTGRASQQSLDSLRCRLRNHKQHRTNHRNSK
jgi:hypothetical protein